MVGAASSHYHRSRSSIFRKSAYFSALEVGSQTAFANIELVIKIHGVIIKADASRDRVVWAKASVGNATSLDTPQEV
jgi:hypothetical protein